MSIVTRFAPSPTGYLHIGGLRTALFNYLYARQNGGKFLLRIEDTDMARNNEDAAQAIIDSFKWVGLSYDGEVEYQSKRFAIYTRYIKELLEQKKAYYCYMSKEELESLRKQAEIQGTKWRYDNRYRDFNGTPPSGVEPVVRIKAPLSGQIRFIDGVKGEICIDAKELDDFIIARADGSPTYNFVVTIDDALMGVSDVIRGDDHLNNTPKQIILYEALGFSVPRFYHLPMILNQEGKKLSKRDGAVGVMEYKKLGYLPQSLLNFLVRLGWSYGDEEIFSLTQMLEYFNPSNLNTSASSANFEKLLWLNHHYITNLANDSLCALLEDFDCLNLQQWLTKHNKSASYEAVRDVLFVELKERSKTLVEFANNLNAVLLAPTHYDEKLTKKLDSAGIDLLIALRELFNNELDSTKNPTTIESLLHNFIQSRALKIGQVMPLLRLALLGKGGGIGVNIAIFTLGKDEVLLRLDSCIEHFKGA